VVFSDGTKSGDWRLLWCSQELPNLGEEYEEQMAAGGYLDTGEDEEEETQQHERGSSEKLLILWPRFADGDLDCVSLLPSSPSPCLSVFSCHLLIQLSEFRLGPLSTTLCSVPKKKKNHSCQLNKLKFN